MLCLAAARSTDGQPQDRKQCKGAFEADIILKGMIKWGYDKKISMGVKFPSYFKDAETGGATFGMVVALLTAVCISTCVSVLRLMSLPDGGLYHGMDHGHTGSHAIQQGAICRGFSVILQALGRVF